SLERDHQFPIDVNRRFWLLESSGKRDADVRMLRFAGPIHNAAHDRNLEISYAGIFGAPHRHLLSQVGLNVFSHVLEESGRCSSAPWTRGDLRVELAKTKRLKDLLCYKNFFSAIPVWLRR